MGLVRPQRGFSQLPDRAFCRSLRTVEQALLDKGDLSMKALISAVVVGMATAAGVSIAPDSAGAAELEASPPVHLRPQHAAPWCGPCGCLHVSYEYHRELRSTYGLGFDPRNYDQTEPHYFWGPVRAYPRYWCDAETPNKP
jgi:hypothetical protein